MGFMDGAKSQNPNRIREEAMPVKEDVGADKDVVPMEIDSRGDARGQTEEMIRAQEQRIKDTQAGLWGRR